MRLRVGRTGAPAAPGALACGGWAALLCASLALACTERHEHDMIVVGMANAATNLDPRVGSDEASQKAHQLLYSTLDADRREAQAGAGPRASRSSSRIRSPTSRGSGTACSSTTAGSSPPRMSSTRSAASWIPPSAAAPVPTACSASVTAVDRYTVKFTLKEPFGPFPVNLVMGIVQAGSGLANARQPIGSGPYQLGEFVQDDRLVLRPFAGHYRGAPANAGLVLKVVPDDTMRGLELRKGTVDLVVNDLAPDIVWQLRAEGRLQVTTAPGTRLRLHRAQSARCRAAEPGRAEGDRVRHRSRGDRDIPATRIRPRGGGDRAADVVGVRARTSSTSVTIPVKRAGCSTRPASPIPTATAHGPGCGCR